ncbi:HET protein [Glarea lozoyensis ATCC 20868]|uniref:HET protein n=1 Tax=Glarea lozoyensis (strain ATCC 20868 / MF5171) TaxID=1116229 RepID=S3DUS2_GLAL2|nr:HET protein [Glarea lozoyensis ATCC 20868]EPE35701.1 HET protein [Glarea lozoyensis ATCC 20868]
MQDSSASWLTIVKEDVRTISLWQEECTRNHPSCGMGLSQNPLETGKSLPTRCLELTGSSDGSCRFQLRETKGRTGDYLILSHRWMQETPKCNTNEVNYFTRLHSGPLEPEYLTPLFQEAGEMALRLGIRYIWIDSLCIIQDSAEDWKAEAMMMGSYYQNAWATIAATMTNQKPLDVSRSPSANKASRITRLPYRDKSGKQQGYFYIQSLQNATISQTFEKSVAESELLTRGWVFQEWILSPRLLTSTNAGIMLVCRSGLPQSLAGAHALSVSNSKQGFALKTSLNLNMDSRQLLFKSWRMVVEKFSGLSLTSPDLDRLVSLSGIAIEFGQALQKLGGHDIGLHQYISGLWIDDILLGLLWEQGSSGPRRRLKGIPTWSWASMMETAVLGMRVCWRLGSYWKDGWEVPASGYYRSRFSYHSTSGDSAMRDTVHLPPYAPPEPVCKLENVCTIELKFDKIAKVWNEHLDQQFFSAASYDLSMYSNEKRFVALELLGKLLPVSIHGIISTTDIDDFKLLDRTGARRGPKVSQDIFGPDPDVERGPGSDTDDQIWSIRREVSSERDTLLRGWASLEHEKYQSNDTVRGGVYALPIYRLLRTQESNDRLTTGPMGMKVESVLKHSLNTAFVVLFLRRRQDSEPSSRSQYFERIGIGRLFGQDFEEEFVSNNETKIWLV